MIQKIKNQNISHKAFTLIEMVVVLIIIWIMLMATVFLSGEQIQKVKDKTVKESILAEMQSRYSRNLWSSSFASWIMYDSMDVTFTSWDNKITFKYNTRDDENGIENIFTDRFEIKFITTGYVWWENAVPTWIENIVLTYSPYKIYCKIWGEEIENVVFVIRVNDNKDYCFEIDRKNCRLVEISNSKCSTFEELAPIN